VTAVAAPHAMNTNSGFSEGGRERLREAIEKQVQLDFQQRLLKKGFKDVIVPALHQSFDLE